MNNKLIEMELVKQDQYGAYVAERKVDASALGPFLLLGSVIVPRFVFYAAFFTVFAAYYVIQAVAAHPAEPLLVWPAILLGLASAAFWFEALSAWRSAPSP